MSLISLFVSPVILAWLLMSICFALLASVVASAKWRSENRNYQNSLACYARAEHLRQKTRAIEEEQAEATRQACLANMEALNEDIETFGRKVRDINEVVKLEYRAYEVASVVYYVPDVEGALELAVEVATLHRVVLALHRDFADGRINLPNVEFFQQWMHSLQHSFTSWEQKRAKEQMEGLLARLHHLEEMLSWTHRVQPKQHPMPHSSIPVESYKDIFSFMEKLNDFLAMRLESKTANLVEEVIQYTADVEYIERQHEALDDASFSWCEKTRMRVEQCEKTQMRIERVAISAWKDVLMYAFDTSPDFLSLSGHFYESSLRQEEEYELALTLLAKSGECVQHKAMEHLSISMKHWGIVEC